MDINRSIIRSEVRQAVEEYLQSSRSPAGARRETPRLEATTESTSQRLNSQVGQVVNRARDILRSNTSTFTRNVSSSFRSGATSHGAFPKRPRIAGASRYKNVLPKEVCKTVVLLESPELSNGSEYPLSHDIVICYAEVDFLTTDDELLVRNKIVEALKTQLPDIALNDIEFVKVLSKRVTTPLVADGYNWDYKHIKNLCGQGKLYVRLVENKQLGEAVESVASPEERTIPEEGGATSGEGGATLGERGANRAEPACPSVKDDEDDFRCLHQMFPQHGEDFLREVIKDSLDLQEAIDAVLSSGKEKVTLAEVLHRLRDKILTGPEVKINIDPDDLLADTIAYYKNPRAFDASKPIRVQYKNQPAVDIGGIRRQFFNDATKAIATSPNLKLLEGLDHRKVPAYNSSSVHSGLMEVLGRLIGHGILQSSIGFPYFAPPVYWYIATGDVHKSLCYATIDDVRDEQAMRYMEKMAGATSLELQDLRQDSDFISLCNECGIMTLVSDDNRNLILQSLLLHHVLNRKKVLLDQLRGGLMSSKVLPAIEKNPTLFEPLFVYNEEALDAAAIKGLMKPKSPLSDEHCKVWDYLFQFLDECNETDLKTFMRFLTGCESILAAGIEGRNITVSFNVDGTIFSSTCLHQLELPGRVNSYSEFEMALKAVIYDVSRGKSFNSI